MAKEKDKSKPKVVKMTDAEERKMALEICIQYYMKKIRYMEVL